jgi:hypothetical protein
MLKGFVGFDRIRTDEELKLLAEKAKEDNHGVFLPTHLLKKDGEQVGYFSVGMPGAVLVFAWLSTKEVPPRESFHLINAVEFMVSTGGGKRICFPVPKDSPFHPIMESMGYKSGGTYEFFVKEL